MFTGKLNPRLLLNLTIVSALLFGSALLPTRVHAIGATITVNTSADNTTTNSLCSLREAITNANDDTATYADCLAGSGNDTILFAAGITAIVIGSTLPTITDPDGLTINGGSDVTIDGSDTYRILMVDSSGSLTLANLTVKDGACTSCIGGGVYSGGGTLVVTNSTFTSNSQGIYSYDSVTTITNSTFTGNTSTYGGAVNQSGTFGSLTVTNSTFSGNDGSGGGSAIYTNLLTTITNSSFTNNTGGLTSSVSVLFIDGGSDTTITKSTISGTGGATTRGIYNNGGVLKIANSTFFGNSTSDSGGAVLSSGGIITIKNSTFSGNSATSGGSDIYQSGPSAALNLYNTILANDGGGGNCSIIAGTVSGNNNLIEDASNACGFTNGVNGNIIGSDPNLGAPTGSPAYFPLNSGSLAMNAGDDTICSTIPVSNTSQNEIPRPQGTHCEIGSFESPLTLTFTSVGSHDGWALESTETSKVGGTLNSSSAVLNLGDDAQDRQYRAILSFDLSTLPAGAVVTKATLKIRKQGQVGANPFATLGKIMVDIRTGAFSNNNALQATDFHAAAHKNAGAVIQNTPVNNWYSVVFPSASISFLNLTGVTQFRLRFQLDDNDNATADYLKFYTGNFSTAAARPTLIIQYYIP